MKQLARKPRHISLVPPAIEQSADEPSAASLPDFFDGWLTSVSSTLVDPEAPRSQASQITFGNRPLTTTDVMRVNRATVRESTEHRHWPQEVVQTFMTADVIRRHRAKSE